MKQYKKKMVIIANPAAGNSGNIDILNQLTDSFQSISADNTAQIIHTEYAGHAVSIAEQAGTDVFIVAAGGDGTVNEVINGMHENAVLGILPFGTANVAALEIYGKSHDVHLAVKSILKGCTEPEKQVKTMDLGQVNNKKFIMSVGIGVDGSITKNVSTDLKKIIHRGAYALELIFTLFFRKIPIQHALFTDQSGRHRKIKAKSILVMNTPNYAGPFILSSRASLNDGLLDVCIFHNINFFYILFGLVTLIFFGPDVFSRLNGISHFQCPEIYIKSWGAPSQADGDWFSDNDLRIRVLRSSLKYFGL